MNILLPNFSFRKGQEKDILQLESCRLKSIKKLRNLFEKQIDIWINSKPNWKICIQNTILCTTENEIVGFVVCDDQFLTLLHVDPTYQKQGIGNKLVSLVEKPNIKCDCNIYSEKILIKRGWKFISRNPKIRQGETFENKWYAFKFPKSTQWH